MVLITLYPVLWVVTIAFSGEQSLAIADLPADPDVARPRCAPSLPWPEHVSVSNFVAVFDRAAVRPLAAQQRHRRRRRPRCSACSWPAPRPTPSRASGSPAGAPA